MNEHFSTLHARVLQQQRLLEEQITQLRLLHGDSNIASIPPQNEKIPRTLADLRCQIQERLHLKAYSATGTVELFAFGEKESASTIFLKYSQALMKWAELELVLLKEWARSDDINPSYEETRPPSDEEISIVRRFLENRQT